MKDASEQSGASFFVMAGYSATPLQKKLGIKEGMSMHLVDAPDHYFDLVSPLPEQTIVLDKLSTGVDFIHIFSTDQKAFKKEFVRSKKYVKKNGMIWVSWPKRTSKVPTDLNENIIREFGLAEGMVDVKVCAVDDVWSGLKFVFRLKDR